MSLSTAAITKKNNKIFRYKLSCDIMLNITQFAKLHQFDDRHCYKEAWTQWLIDYQDNIEREIIRLHHLNYTGDILDKMFKAGRYYFREKITKEKKSTSVNKIKRDYIVIDPNIIISMDNHLTELIQTKNFKPSLAYKQYCVQSIDLLRTEIQRLINHANITEEKIAAKFKKTYKNRYFILHNTASTTTAQSA